MKKYINRKRAEVNEYRVEDLVMLSTKDLKYQIVGRRTEKLTERFIGSYKVKKIISANAVELELSSTIKIHLVIIEGEKEQKIKRILNKQQIREKDKYLVQ